MEKDKEEFRNHRDKLKIKLHIAAAGNLPITV